MSILTLKGTGRVLLLACKGNLRLLPVQDFHNLSVRYVAHLIVLLDHFAVSITYTTLIFWHQGIASFI
jgi:hypothetical protein